MIEMKEGAWRNLTRPKWNSHCRPRQTAMIRTRFYQTTTKLCFNNLPFEHCPWPQNVHLFEHVRIIISLGASARGEGSGCKERVRKREKRTNPSPLFSPSSLGVFLRYSSRCTKAVQLLISKIIQCLPVSPQELPLGAQAPSSLCKTTSLPWLQVVYSRPKIHSVPEHKKIVANKDLKVILPLDYKTFSPN